jgi:hypothetical protein
VSLKAFLFPAASVEDSVDNCVETGTLDTDWSQPEVVAKPKRGEEKAKKAAAEVAPADDFGGLDWSRPLASAAAKDEDDELKLVPIF